MKTSHFVKPLCKWRLCIVESRKTFLNVVQSQLGRLKVELWRLWREIIWQPLDGFHRLNSQFHVISSCLAHMNAAIAWYWRCHCELHSVIGCTKYMFFFFSSDFVERQHKINTKIKLEEWLICNTFPILLTGIRVCFTSVVLLFWPWNDILMFLKMCLIWIFV